MGLSEEEEEEEQRYRDCNGAVALGLAVELDLGSGGATRKGTVGGPGHWLSRGQGLIIQRFQLTGWMASLAWFGFGGFGPSPAPAVAAALRLVAIWRSYCFSRPPLFMLANCNTMLMLRGVELSAPERQTNCFCKTFETRNFFNLSI